MLPVGTHTQGLERLPCNLDHSLSQFLLVYQWNVCGSTRICQMRICCASLEHHFIFEDSVEYDESLPWLEARRDLFSKLFLLVLIALSKIFPPYLLSLCLSNTSMKEFYFFRAVAVFQKHINSPSGMAWCPKCSGYPQPMYILWLLVEVLNVSQPIFSIKLYQIVFLKRALMTFFLSKGTQWFHTVTKINYRFFNKMLKIFHTLAPDQYVGLTTSSSYYYTYLT